MHVLSTLFTAGLLASTVIAHPGGHGHEAISGSSLQKRGVMAKRCAGATAAEREAMGQTARKA